MSDEHASPSARMSAAFAKLRDTAKQINSVSDELSRSVAAIERALDRLNLRVACWTLISEHKGNDGDSFAREYVGYIEEGKRWRIVINTADGFESRPDEVDEKTWLFDEGPQYLRAKAIDKLPDLIEALVATADKTTERLKKKVASAQELASVATALSLRKSSVTR